MTTIWVGSRRRTTARKGIRSTMIRLGTNAFFALFQKTVRLWHASQSHSTDFTIVIVHVVYFLSVPVNLFCWECHYNYFTYCSSCVYLFQSFDIVVNLFISESLYWFHRYYCMSCFLSFHSSQFVPLRISLWLFHIVKFFCIFVSIVCRCPWLRVELFKLFMKSFCNYNSWFCI